jgi:hypothetical protein
LFLDQCLKAALPISFYCWFSLCKEICDFYTKLISFVKKNKFCLQSEFLLIRFRENLIIVKDLFRISCNSSIVFLEWYFKIKCLLKLKRLKGVELEKYSFNRLKPSALCLLPFDS